ncbi:uncharacterized protein FYW23_015461 isoform 2-T2 [Sylvia borin]
MGEPPQAVVMKTFGELDEACEEKIQSHLQSLRKVLAEFLEWRVNEEKRHQDYLDMSEAERRRIQAEFERLRQLLAEQERTVLGRLAELDDTFAATHAEKSLRVAEGVAQLHRLIAQLEARCLPQNVGSILTSEMRLHLPSGLPKELEKSLSSCCRQSDALWEALEKLRGRREQASEGQWHTWVPVLGCRVADLSQGLNYAALIEKSTSRSSLPLEASDPALAAVIWLPPNPYTTSSAISGDSPRDRLSHPAGQLSVAIPCCGSSILFISFCSIHSIHTSPPFRCSPFGDTYQRPQSHPARLLAPGGRGRPWVSPSVPPRPYRGPLSRAWAATRALGAALPAPSRPRRGFSGDSGTGHGSVRLSYRRLGRAAAQLSETRGSGHPEGRLTPHRTATDAQGKGHPEGQLFFAASPRPPPSCRPFTAISCRGVNFWENIYTEHTPDFPCYCRIILMWAESLLRKEQ